MDRFHHEPNTRLRSRLLVLLDPDLHLWNSTNRRIEQGSSAAKQDKTPDIIPWKLPRIRMAFIDLAIEI